MATNRSRSLPPDVPVFKTELSVEKAAGHKSKSEAVVSSKRVTTGMGRTPNFRLACGDGEHTRALVMPSPSCCG